MGTTASDYRAAQQSRTKALVIPREHGAWGILLVPLVAGACVGMRQGHGLSELVMFLTAALALFWLRAPLEVLLGSSVMQAHTKEEKKVVWQAAILLTVTAAAPLYLLLRGGQRPGLLVIGAITGCAFAVQACLKLFGRRWRMPAQIIGAIGLTSTAAGAYYVVTDKLDIIAFTLWFANWLFAGDQIHYVQLRLHTVKVFGAKARFSRGWAFLTGQVVMLMAIAGAAALGAAPLLLIIAFVPVVIRGLLWLFQKQEGIDLQWLGITELLHAITFGMLVIFTFYIPR